MGNWKELGEVPDSDDEEFDAHEFLEAELDHDTLDVWSVPSTPRDTQEHRTSPVQRHGKQPIQTEGSQASPPYQFSRSEHKPAHDAESNQSPLKIDASISSEPAPSILRRKSEISTSPVPTTANDSAFPTRNGTSPLRSGSSLQGDEELILATLDASDEFSQNTARLGRSLRPRKPIQQHPYALENAQYSHFMKSHGIRPVRVDPEAERLSDSQEDRPLPEPGFRGQENEVSPRDVGSTVSGDSHAIVVDDDDDRTLRQGSPPTPKTSSPWRLLPASSQPSSGDQTDNASLFGDDELPTLDELAHHRFSVSSRGVKRRRSPNASALRKRLKVPDDFWELSHSPETPSRRRLTASVCQAASSPPLSLQGPPPTTVVLPQRAAALSIANHSSIAPGSVSAEEDEENRTNVSLGSSDSDSEMIRQNRKRIKGVLPASWLRLDQKTGRDTMARAGKRTMMSPGLLARKGVAIMRHVATRASEERDHYRTAFYGQSDYDITVSRPQEGLQLRVDGVWDDISQDDDVSVIEEDNIDQMIPRSKRSNRLCGRGREPKRQRKRAGSVQTKRKAVQLGITEMLVGKENTTCTSPKSSKITDVTQYVSEKPSIGLCQLEHPFVPPLLSILDLETPGAPQFIRVAARAARSRADLGKSSPSKKHIDLGNRLDNLDALSVLRDWKRGLIKPKVASVPRRKQSSTKIVDTTREPLQQTSNNARARPSVHTTGLSFTRPARIAKQTSLVGFIRSNEENAYRQGHRPPPSFRMQRAPRSSPVANTSRPAQLETAEQEGGGGVEFIARKRALDALYRKARKHLPSSSTTLDGIISKISLTPRALTERAESANPPPEGAVPGQRPRLRKRIPPNRIDLDAPQFAHANDPLPDREEGLPDAGGDYVPERRLIGLGRFGTQYTQHFEIFPLNPGIFFHESTLLGSGILIKALDGAYNERLHHLRPGMSFDLGEQCLHWGPWSDTVSSELGVVFDCIVDQIKMTKSLPTSSLAVDASTFILNYVLCSLSFDGEDAANSCIGRFSELLLAFVSRVQPSCLRRGQDSEPRNTFAQLEVEVRLLLVAFLLLRIVQGSNLYSTEGLQAEETMRSLAKMTADTLVSMGLEDLQHAYDDLQQIQARERGIRNDRLLLNCWVVLIRVLENAHIPRGGFWDIAYSSLIPTGIIPGYNVQKFEALWQKMFVLLPLSEFDDSGVLVPGLRHSDPLIGWALPQQMLKRVFETYQINPRQPPSFNDYCRALVGRCHYLLEQWGWFKCSGIVGIIFDFFGSRNLAHLRNEEAYRSPRFLEELAGRPSLSIEPEDRCFHVFLKMLALAIFRLRRLGLNNDVRNLVARTLPNHNRQYSREQVIHQHELAALRNHHDLLCTLFWAAPPDVRPAVHVIEKLVLPGSSHKEACLISLRAWNQLARFVVSSGEANESYRPFMLWQSSVFQQVLDQYLSAAADIAQQFQALSKDVSSSITQDTVDKMILKNKAAAMDILHSSVRGSLDVLRHAPTLHAAMRSLNAGQLGKVFDQLDMDSVGFDWAILTAAIETLEHFMSLVEKAMDEQYSNDSSVLDQDHLEEAVLFLDQKLAGPLFSMARVILALPKEVDPAISQDQTTCVEKVISLASRVASRFIHSGVTRLLPYFKPGKYSLFEELPTKLDLQRLRYLSLFLAILVKNNIFDFRDIGTTIFELWMSSIAKPRAALCYETYLGEMLKLHNFPYLEETVLPPGERPDYNLARDLFSSGVAYMRKSLRSAEPPRRRQLRSDYAKILRLVMDQIKQHLKALVRIPAEHHHYVNFVRGIIATIKSHGADICPVDAFYYQPSQEYGPCVEDPQLHTAGIIAYGIRLIEADVTAVPQLFYYLYNNFKVAMANGLLDEECKILQNGMSNPSVFSFVLGKMVPAVIRATAQAHEAWPLLDVYVTALQKLSTKSCLPRELPDGSINDLSCLLRSVLQWATDKRASSDMTTRFSPVELYILVRILTLCNMFHGSLQSWHTMPLTTQTAELARLVENVTDLADAALFYLEELYGLANGEMKFDALFARDLLGGAGQEDTGEPGMLIVGDKDPHVESFSKHIAADVRKNWVVTSGIITVRLPAKPPSPSATQSGQGTKHRLGTGREILEDLCQELRLWTLRIGRRRRGRPVRPTWRHFRMPIF